MIPLAGRDVADAPLIGTSDGMLELCSLLARLGEGR